MCRVFFFDRCCLGNPTSYFCRFYRHTSSVVSDSSPFSTLLVTTVFVTTADTTTLSLNSVTHCSTTHVNPLRLFFNSISCCRPEYVASPSSSSPHSLILLDSRPLHVSSSFIAYTTSPLHLLLTNILIFFITLVVFILELRFSYFSACMSFTDCFDI